MRIVRLGRWLLRKCKMVWTWRLRRIARRLEGAEMKNRIHISWGFVIEATILGLLIGVGIEKCGEHIGEGISRIEITVVKGATNG